MFIHIFFSVLPLLYTKKSLYLHWNKQQTRFANENENGDLQI